MATNSGAATVTLPTDDQILITRDFDAPKHLIYQAWTSPELVKQWWSGQHGTVTLVEIDLRVGGRWRYVIGGDGGFDLAFHGEFREIIPNQHIVYTEVFEMQCSAVQCDADAAVVTLTLIETDGRTRLTLRTQTRTKEVRDAIIDSGMESGMQAQMDALERTARVLS